MHRIQHESPATYSAVPEIAHIRHSVTQEQLYTNSLSHNMYKTEEKKKNKEQKKEIDEES